MTDGPIVDRLGRYPFFLLGLALWATFVAVAVLTGDRPVEAARFLLLPAALLAWGGHVLDCVDGLGLRALGALVLLAGGVGELALYVFVAPGANVLALTLLTLAGIVLVVVGNRTG